MYTAYYDSDLFLGDAILSLIGVYGVSGLELELLGVILASVS
jgi:hypothetical protein